jgi:hypothetical protein
VTKEEFEILDQAYENYYRMWRGLEDREGFDGKAIWNNVYAMAVLLDRIEAEMAGDE